MKIIISIFVGLSLVVALFFSLFHLSKIAGSAMEPEFPNGKYVLSQKFLFATPNPSRGQVVFYTKEEASGNDFIGRIVGLPGETLLAKGGDIYLDQNGQKSKVEENYLNQEAPPYLYPEDEWIKLDDFSYLILPDKRDKGVDLNLSKVNRANIKSVFLYKF